MTYEEELQIFKKVAVYLKDIAETREIKPSIVQEARNLTRITIEGCLYQAHNDNNIQKNFI